ncbi:kinase-like protein [Lentithecium fluviatile CBS 122367]|uniref:non-specific serine/threonine protein kinase n=1 Tax=Lentithecium fluviatile CBS 122367 TaxID=1168545 RepID=A0A6G1JF43_9PLEO|nr:kinase-like protein [Lentithecium fluviatile CBS 122367]
MPREKSNYPDRYTAHKHLRRHGSGTLIVVQNRRDGEWYVEKKYDRNIEQALQEVRRLQHLRHAYIHNVVESWAENNHQWASIWFEPIDQGTLSGLIKAHAVDGLQIFERYCWKVFYQIAAAMRYCHHSDGEFSDWHPIIHRNLTPQNILLTTSTYGAPTPDVRITGFECAMWVGYPDENQVGLKQVNRDFAPPEAPEYCKASDVYQIGCVMLCMLNLMLKPEPLTRDGEKYGEELRAIVRACLKRTPENRYTSDKLATLVQGGKIHANIPIRGRLLLIEGPLDVDVPHRG